VKNTGRDSRVDVGASHSLWKALGAVVLGSVEYTGYRSLSRTQGARVC